jgi:ADP-heptose:LPS heptosyltransferase
VPRYLIIRFSSIGDIVLTTPVLRSLKKSGDCEIHYLTKESYREVLAGNPYIDRLFCIRRDVSELKDELRNQHYDHVIDLHKNLRSWRTLLALKRPFSSFNKLNKKKWLYVNFRINLLPDVHIAERYLEAAAFAGVKYDGGGLDFYIDEETDVRMMLPPAFRKKYVCIVAGAKQYTKRIPASLISRLAEGLKLPVVLLGGREDSTLAEEISDASPEKVFNACGMFSLQGSAALIRDSALVITADTGLMHIAAALKKPVITLWGNTVHAFGMYPLLPDDLGHLSAEFEINGLQCRPCTKLGYSRCPKKHFNCMMQHDVEAILSRAAGFISN